MKRRTQWRMWQRYWIIASVFIVTAFCYANFYLDSFEDSKPETYSTEVYRLRWNSALDISSAGPVVGIRSGVFKRAGINLELAPGIDDASTALSVSENIDQIGKIGLAGFLKARSSGLDIVAFAGSYGTSSVEIYTLDTASLVSATELQSKRIAFGPSIDSELALRALSEKYALSRTRMATIKEASSVQLLLDGKADVVLGHWESEGLQLKQSQRAFKSVSISSLGVNPGGSVYFTSRNFLNSRPNAILSFVVGLIDSWDLTFDEGSEVCISVGLSSFNCNETGFLDAMDLQRMYLRPFGSRVGELDLSRFRDVQDLMLKQQAINRTIDLYSAATVSFLSEAYRGRLKKNAITP